MSPLPSPTTALFLTNRSTAATAAALRQPGCVQLPAHIIQTCVLRAHRFASASLLALACTLSHDRVRQRACDLLRPCSLLMTVICRYKQGTDHPPGQELVLGVLQHSGGAVLQRVRSDSGQHTAQNETPKAMTLSLTLCAAVCR